MAARDALRAVSQRFESLEDWMDGRGPSASRSVLGGLARGVARAAVWLLLLCEIIAIALIVIWLVLVGADFISNLFFAAFFFGLGLLSVIAGMVVRTSTEFRPDGPDLRGYVVFPLMLLGMFGAERFVLWSLSQPYPEARLMLIAVLAGVAAPALWVMFRRAIPDTPRVRRDTAGDIVCYMAVGLGIEVVGEALIRGFVYMWNTGLQYLHVVRDGHEPLAGIATLAVSVWLCIVAVRRMDRWDR